MTTIGLIGSGPTAIYTAHALLTQAFEPLAITMFEAQDEAGKGMPYSPEWNSKEMLSNIASIEIPPLTHTLVEWLLLQSDDVLEKWDIQRAAIDERAFYPRLVLGEYFHAQLEELIMMAYGQGSMLTIHTGTPVVDVMMEEESVSVHYRSMDHSSESRHFDYAVLATGHSIPEHSEVRPGYFTSPWPATALDSIGKCRVGIRGSSLSAIDAAVALASSRGEFVRSGDDVLQYISDEETDSFSLTMLSRKGLLPEADFYHPIPYEPLQICTEEAVQALIESKCSDLLEATYNLFKQELIQSAPKYAGALSLAGLTLEEFCRAYYAARLEQDPFEWAKQNLEEAKKNHERGHTVAWRYAILRMHEVVSSIAPHLNAEDHARFNKHFKPVFVDDYATVPHTSIERLLALHEAKKLSIIATGDEYQARLRT